jgi:hypothetical protein
MASLNPNVKSSIKSEKNYNYAIPRRDFTGPQNQSLADTYERNRFIDFMNVPTGHPTGIIKPEYPVVLPRVTGNDAAFRIEQQRYKDEIKAMKKKYESGDGSFHVEFIAGHRVYKSKPEVLVAWYGFKDLTWELFENVASTSQFRFYTIDYGLTFNEDHIIVQHDHETFEEIY